MNHKRIAIIGAGIAGLTLGLRLCDKADVTLFEKSRGIGGRMATRYAHDYYFDHGAQFFTAKTQAFQSFIQPLIDEGHIKPWEARFVEIDNNQIIREDLWTHEHPHYVGTPHMNAVGKILGKSLDIRKQTHIKSIQKEKNTWSLLTDENQLFEDFDWVITTCPALQSLSLLPQSFSHKKSIESIKMSACISLMLGYKEAISSPFDVGIIKNRDVSWISFNNHKPNRPPGQSIVITSSNDWADAHWHEDKDKIMQHLLAEAVAATALPIENYDHMDCQIWKFANCSAQDGKISYIDENLQLAACGDWCIQGRVEWAFTSANDLSQALGEHL